MWQPPSLLTSYFIMKHVRSLAHLCPLFLAVFGVLVVGTTRTEAAPTINTQPTGAIICAGTNVVLTVQASGSGNLSYQWQLNRTNISGQVQSTISLSNIQPIEQGHYRVLVTDSTGTTTSSEALVVVLFPPSVVAQTGNLTVMSGQSVNFKVLVTAKPPPTYQWRKDGVNISGATNNTYSIASVTAADAATYDCVLNNSCGTVTSTGSVLTVDAPPLIVSNPVSQSVDPGTNVLFSVVASGSPTLNYQWCKDGVAIAGATNTSITLTNVQLIDEGDYVAKVTNPFGSVTSQVATLTVSGRPFITLHPVSQAVLLGDSATFMVQAEGRAPLSYQWMKDGVDIAGATGTNLTINNIQLSDLANYSARAFNNEGTATSTNATLTISSRLVMVQNVNLIANAFSQGTQVTVPVWLVSEGGENRLTFSLAYDASFLNYSSVNGVFANSSVAGAVANANGILTFDWQLPAGQSVSGIATNQIFDIVFTVNTVTNQSIVILGTESSPTTQQILGTSGQQLSGRFLDGSVVFNFRDDAVVSPLTGFFEESMAIVYTPLATEPLNFPQFVFSNLGVDSLNNPITIQNSTITNAAGNPISIYPGVLNPGVPVSLVNEYLVSDRETKPNPTIELLTVRGTLPTLPEGGEVLNSADVREVFVRAETILDFPSVVGRTYYIQYRTTGTTTWTTSFPPVTASGVFTRWVDVGAPRTTSKPTSGGREYQVVETQ